MVESDKESCTSRKQRICPDLESGLPVLHIFVPGFTSCTRMYMCSHQNTECSAELRRFLLIVIQITVKIAVLLALNEKLNDARPNRVRSSQSRHKDGRPLIFNHGRSTKCTSTHSQHRRTLPYRTYPVFVLTAFDFWLGLITVRDRRSTSSSASFQIR